MLVNILPNTFRCMLMIANNIIMEGLRSNFTQSSTQVGPWPAPYRVVGGVHFANYFSIICLS